MIEVAGVSVRAGSFTLDDVSLRVDRGEWGILLGPTGAGKTTVLEAIAGVRRLGRGQVRLRGRDVTGDAPEHRGVGMVYQHAFLFPHLGVAENIAYGEREPGLAGAMARRFGADALADRPVASLSGGERQLVALARALATKPDILLLDEPFAALDGRTRTRVRRELRALRDEWQLTILQVTHDFAEAGTLGDHAILMESGRVVQSGEPATLFRAPATRMAAEFLGAENVLAGMATPLAEGSGDDVGTLRFASGALALVAVGQHPGGPAHAVVRGEDIMLARERPGPSSVRNVLDGTVIEVQRDGALARITVEISGAALIAVVTMAAAVELGLSEGVRVVASVKATAVHLC